MITIAIPLAGRGQRFAEKGYTFPKPLIEIHGKPMIQLVVENVRPDDSHKYAFVVQQEHKEKYSIDFVLSQIAPGCSVVSVNGVTQGAACTVLLLAEFLDNGDELLIANSDQYVELNIDEFLRDARSRELDGSILTFRSAHPKWSYALTDKDGYVVEVQEKKPISTHATVGIYYYRQGRMFVHAAKQMIKKDIRTNNEFYVAPAFNEMILSGSKIGIYEIETGSMHGLGTPEDLEEFLKSSILSRT